MCVVSMVMDHYTDKWQKIIPMPEPVPYYPPMAPTPQITPEEIAEFKRLLERAREYDKRNNEPECELEEKKEIIRKLAKQLGVDLDSLLVK